MKLPETMAGLHNTAGFLQPTSRSYGPFTMTVSRLVMQAISAGISPFSPDYSRCVAVKIENACFDWGIVPSLWLRQFTHHVN
jgi:hypothetical protein